MGNRLAFFRRNAIEPYRRIWHLDHPKPLSIQDAPNIPPNSSNTDLSSRALSVVSIDFCISQNGLDHNTSRFEVMKRKTDPCLVIRRGTTFLLKIKFNRPLDQNTDGVSFIFTVEDATNPSAGVDTMIVVSLYHSQIHNGIPWSAVVEEQSGNDVLVKIITSTESIVAKWKIEVDTMYKREIALSYTHPLPFYLLFNPWCPMDSVYNEVIHNRREYVSSDVGLIYTGTDNNIEYKAWNYAQYEKDILDCALYLISVVGKVRDKSRGDPLQVSRAISSVINSCNNEGVLKGNWDGVLRSGTKPTDWAGSMTILQTYFRNKQPVSSGQCWVFAGIVTTICRAIGIPCRPVTTFNSAHDTRNSLTIDYFLDENGREIEDPKGDAIWNFHVWNEVWMQRPDLGTDYSGWQVIDATPQEIAGHYFKCGPASVVAIKKGEVRKPYDNGFIFSEVNADVLYWKHSGPDRPLKLIRKDIRQIGKHISTKAVGKWDREDITGNYKFPASSSDERTSMIRALKMTEQHISRFYLNQEFHDIRIIFVLKDNAKLGQLFSALAFIQNHSPQKEYTVSCYLRVDTISCSANVGKVVKTKQFEKVLSPISNQEVKMEISFAEYHKLFVDQCDFKVTCFATVAHTDFDYFDRQVYRLRKPNIMIRILGTPYVDEEIELSFELQNPLPIALTRGEYRVEGCGLEKPMVIPLKRRVSPQGFAIATMKMIPKVAGIQAIVVKFISREINDVDGFIELNVE